MARTKTNYAETNGQNHSKSLQVKRTIRVNGKPPAEHAHHHNTAEPEKNRRPESIRKTDFMKSAPRAQSARRLSAV